jgi:alanyl-tRNA synthetase
MLLDAISLCKNYYIAATVEVLILVAGALAGAAFRQVYKLKKEMETVTDENDELTTQVRNLLTENEELRQEVNNLNKTNELNDYRKSLLAITNELVRTNKNDVEADNELVVSPNNNSFLPLRGVRMKEKTNENSHNHIVVPMSSDTEIEMSNLSQPVQMEPKTHREPHKSRMGHPREKKNMSRVI